jgi:DNA polymerase III epsilon subunit-like protein
MIVVDIEASGLDPKKNSIVSIGAVDFKNPKRQFYAEPRIWDGAECNPESLEINGFTEEECKDPNRNPLKEVMHDFFAWIEPNKEKTLVGQNPSFDRDFLNDSFGRSGISWHFSFRTLDLHTIAYVDYIRRGLDIPTENNRTALDLDAILVYVGIPKEPRPHNALTGAKVEAEALSRILFGKNLLPEFTNYPMPEMF